MGRGADPTLAPAGCQGPGNLAVWTRLSFSWRLASLGLAWLGGAFVHLQLAALPAPATLAALLGVALAGGAVAVWRPGGRLLLVPVAAGLSFGLSSVHASWRLADALPAELEREDLVVQGVVASLPQVFEQGVRFRFEVESARFGNEAARVPAVVQLGWFSGWGGAPQDAHGRPTRAAPADPLPDVRAGDRWRFTVRLRRPHGLRNPHGFDHELFLFEQGVRAVGTVRPGAERLGVSWRHPVERLRQHVRDDLMATVADRRAAGVLAALAVGDQSAIASDDWRIFRDTGISHLVSVSGVHVTMFAWLAGLLLNAAWARAGPASLWVPAPVAARAGGVLAAAAYALFAGWGVPAQRTVLMLAAVTLLQLGGRRWPLGLVLLVAAGVVCAADPWALEQAGFWLSFAAVALLLVASPEGGVPAGSPSRRAWLALHDGVRTQAVATVGLAPLTLVLFQQVSVVGFAANLVAIPVVTLVVTPLALGGAIVAPLWGLGAWVIQQSNGLLVWLGRLPGAVWTAAAAPPWAQAAGVFGAVLAVMPLPWRLRLLAVPLLVPLAAPAVPRPAEGRYHVLAADVGQGSAVLVRTRTRLLLYDTGPAYGGEANAGERVLAPLLRARGEGRIDRLVLSHRDTDHVGGAAPLLERWPVDELLSSLEPGHRLLGLATSDRRCDAGQSWTWDGVRFDVLHPPASDHARPLKPNARSCVVRVSGTQGSVLLAGDIERAQEAGLVAAGVPLASDVLLVPHHGSRTSSTAAFLDAVRPSVAVIQAGHLNRFGHPVADVLDRLAARGVTVVDSPSCGAWHWDGEGPPREARCTRPEGRRYWHHPG